VNDYVLITFSKMPTTGMPMLKASSTCIYIIFISLPLSFSQFLDFGTYYKTDCFIRMVVRRYAMDDLFMLGFMLGFYLLMTFLIELCAWRVRRR